MKKIIFFLVMFILCMSDVTAQKGCCSHHGGEAGCTPNGRTVCADGSLSPSCTCTPAVVYGCTDPKAKNYNSNANKDNGKCTYYIYGCTDKNAINYDKNAEKDDGSCKYDIKGCTNKEAKNYNTSATIDDGSCLYDNKCKAKDENKQTSFGDAVMGLLVIIIVISIVKTVKKKRG